MTEKWTPGPWIAVNGYVRSHTSIEAIKAVGKKSRAVADCRLANGLNDAHLIAAAPDMVQLLIEAVLDENAANTHEWGVRARATLAKARGEE